jgi:hypothetical protein
MAKESAPTINGTVSRNGQPAGSVYVRLIGPSGEFVAERYTQDDGNFTFHVTDGTWTIEARAAGAETARQPVEVSGPETSVTIELASS